MAIPKNDFIGQIGKILNGRQTGVVAVTGNIHDLFCFVQGSSDSPQDSSYVPLIDLLTSQWKKVDNRIVIVYKLNGPVRFVNDADREELKEAWVKFRTGLTPGQIALRQVAALRTESKSDPIEKDQGFESNLKTSQQNSAFALEFLRQLCICSRSSLGGQPVLNKSLIIIIERADLLMPNDEISRLSDADRHRVIVCHDWLSDIDFINSDDAVVMTAESKSMINREISSLPQILEAEVPAPNIDYRLHFIEWFCATAKSQPKFWSTPQALAELTAGLSIHALQQLLRGSSYDQQPINPADVVTKVEAFIKMQLGEDVVEFKRPAHRLPDLIGFAQLKRFLEQELIPRIKSSGPDTLSGAVVCGSIGGGKTYIFEAVAAELGIVVLVIKNLRSQWFGQTDVIFERLRRVLEALSKVLIFVDEADTQFGGVGPDAHETERRLTGKIQAMMSDPRLRGKVHWLLMTARIHLLSPDIRRPGRADLIIPVLDPQGSDRKEFIKWLVQKALAGEVTEEVISRIDQKTIGYSAAAFSSLRSELLAKAKDGKLTLEQIEAVVYNHLPPAIQDTRRYQELQALSNCTRRELLPKPDITDEERQAWENEIRNLEMKGVR